MPDRDAFNYFRPNPVAIFWGTGQTEELGPGLIDRSVSQTAVSAADRPNQRFPFIPEPSAHFYGGDQLGIKILAGADAPAAADRIAGERSFEPLPDNVIIELPPGIWGIFSKFHLAVQGDTVHHMEFRRVMTGMDDIEFIDSTGYANVSVGSTTELHKQIFRTTQTEHYYVTGTHVDSDDEADASYYMGFVRYPDEQPEELRAEIEAGNGEYIRRIVNDLGDLVTLLSSSLEVNALDREEMERLNSNLFDLDNELNGGA